MVTVAKWDAAEVLTSPERIAAIALEDDDPEVLKVAFGNIARAKGMAEIAKKARVGGRASTVRCRPKVIRNLRPLRASSRLWA